MSRHKDIVEDILCRVKDVLGDQFSGDISVKLEQEERRIRLDWGGTEPYIPKRPNRELIKQRAMAELRRGVPIKQVMADTGISRTQIYLLLRKPKNPALP